MAVTRQRIEIEVDVPEGWELTGDYRVPDANEAFLDAAATQQIWLGSNATSNGARKLIVRKKPVPVKVGEVVLLGGTPLMPLYNSWNNSNNEWRCASLVTGDMNWHNEAHIVGTGLSPEQYFAQKRGN